MKIRSAKTSFRQNWFTVFLLTVSSLQIFSSVVCAAISFNVVNLTAGKPATTGYSRFSTIQLNDKGQAAFSGLNPTTARTDVFFWDGTNLNNITKDIPGFVARADIKLNATGQLVFTGSTNFNGFESLPFFYNGTSVQNLAANLNLPISGANFFHQIAINDLGQVAFAGCHQTSTFCVVPHQVFLFTGSQTNQLCDECSFGGLIDNLTLNSRGHVVWSDQQFGGVGFFDGTSVRDLSNDPVAKGAGYFQFSDVRLNNADQMIFSAAKNGRSDTFFFNGSSLTNLTESNAAAGGQGFNQFVDNTLNDTGKAAFVGGKISQAGSQSVFYFDGAVLSNITANDPGAGGAGFNSFACPRFNPSGQLAFFGDKAFALDAGEIFLFSGSGLSNITGTPIAAMQCAEINSLGHLAFFGKDASTTAQRVQDIFFFDGSTSGNITAGQASLSSVTFSQALLKANNADQIIALGFTSADHSTSDVFLLSPTISAAPVLSVSPSSLDFGTVTVNTAKDLTFSVQNTGGGTLSGSENTNSPFSIMGNSSFSLTGGQSHTITVRFTPTSAITFNGNVSVTSNGGNSSVTLIGTGATGGGGGGTPPTATWTTLPPSSITAGQNFTVAWTTTGSPTHVNVHWNPTDPLASGCCLGAADTTDSSTVSPSASPVALTAPIKNADGTLITTPTTVKYVVHVSNADGSGNSAVVSVTVNPAVTGPFITDLIPASGPSDSTVTINGFNFGAVEGTVQFGNKKATITSWATTQVQLIVPSLSPGEYNVTVNTNSKTVSNIVHFAVTATLVPVVLVHGWGGDPTSFGNMRFYLELEGRVVEVFDYSAYTPVPVGDRSKSIESLAGDLANYVKVVLIKYKASQVDIVAHSMGGLIVRAWMGGEAFVPYAGQVRRLVLAGTPNYGAERTIFCGVVSCQTQENEMSYGSQFISGLHAAWQDKRPITPGNVLLIAGTNAEDTHAWDGVVTLTSAAWPSNLGDVTVRYVPYRHCSSTCGNLVSPGQVQSLVDIDTTSHFTYRLVQAFLKDGTILKQSSIFSQTDLGYQPPASLFINGLLFVRLVDRDTLAPVPPHNPFPLLVRDGDPIDIDPALTYSNLHIYPDYQAGTISTLNVPAGSHVIRIIPDSLWKQPDDFSLSISGSLPTVPNAIKIRKK